MIGPQTETQGEYSMCKSRRQHQAEHCSSQISDEDLYHVVFNSAADLGCVERSGICNEIQELQLCWLVPGEQTSFTKLWLFCLSSFPNCCFDMVLRLLFNNFGSKGQVCTIIIEVLPLSVVFSTWYYILDLSCQPTNLIKLFQRHQIKWDEWRWVYAHKFTHQKCKAVEQI